MDRKTSNQIASLKGQLKSSKAAVASTTGVLNVSGKERLGTVAGSGVSSVLYQPGVTGAARLDAFAGLYDLYRTRKVRLIYKPGVGSTINGFIYMGVDFNPTDGPKEVDEVAALNPVVSGTVWQSHQLSVPADRLNKGRWMYTSSATEAPSLSASGVFAIATTAADTPGEWWLEYDVEFASPKKPTAGPGPGPTPPTHSGVNFLGGQLLSGSSTPGGTAHEDYNTTDSVWELSLTPDSSGRANFASLVSPATGVGNLFIVQGAGASGLDAGNYLIQVEGKDSLGGSSVTTIKDIDTGNTLGLQGQWTVDQPYGSFGASSSVSKPAGGSINLEIGVSTTDTDASYFSISWTIVGPVTSSTTAAALRASASGKFARGWM